MLQEPGGGWRGGSVTQQDNELMQADAPGPPVVRPRENAGFLESFRRRLPKGALSALGVGASLAVFALAAYILGKTLSNLSYADLMNAFRATSATQILAALALSALSYVFLTGYDVVALWHMRAHAPYRVAALASFASYAISFNLGFPIITSAAVRYWIYSRVSLSALQVANITVFAGVTFWLGMTLMMGVGFVYGASALAALDGAPALLHAIPGVLILGGVLFYFGWVTFERRRIELRGHALDLPGFVPTVAQFALGVADLCCAAGALYVLLPPGVPLDFVPFVAVYIVACILGVISHAPGGIGVFEATMLHAIPAASQESVLASLLLFRMVYYFIPFVVALALLGADEGARRWTTLREAIARILEERSN
ncbi:MAG: lysylphosphatidylglycerol synthase domain-containing protein [Methylocystis sp.]|uniref:lysylphosphatidylglycerol synthase domain-containing protein n=1 Tax=Methylocystis sp. TaxID=1911079 RepID=UPI003931FC8A